SSFAVTLDLLVALIKSLLFGLLAAIIACDTGLNTRGGPGGVANSVNTPGAFPFVAPPPFSAFTAHIALVRQHAGAPTGSAFAGMLRDNGGVSDGLGTRIRHRLGAPNDVTAPGGC
uniref:ABC transporter permease n=1 Tax=Nocardia cyriacigeorgica TaxID=135487 RepID=UPI002454ECFF